MKKGKSVLLVEDHVVNQKLAIALLTRWGHRVTLAENGQLALDALASHRFDLIFMDMMMPVMDGHEATRRFRMTERGKRTPIVAMTANAMQGDRDRCIAAGMDDYISKPLETAELQRLLLRYLSENDAAGLDHSAEKVMTDMVTTLNFDYDAALRGADQEVVEIIAEVFVMQWPLDKEKMEQALAVGDLKPVLHLSHALKGTLAMFGARPASELAHRAESLAAQGVPEGLGELMSALTNEVNQLLNALQRAGL